MGLRSIGSRLVKRGPGAANTVALEPWEFHPELAALRAAVRAGDWTAAGAQLRQWSDPEDRAALGSLLAATDGVESMLAAAADADPDAKALLGRRTTVLGARLRGRGRFDTLSREQIDGFHEHARRAEALFGEVLADDPANLYAGHGRIVTARALGMGANEVKRRIDLFATHHRHVWAAQASALQGLLPKWGGDWDLARAFVDQCVRVAPGGLPTAALLATYHFERHIAQGNAWIAQAEIRSELVGAAQRSVLHPSFRPNLSSVDVYGVFALTLAYSGAWRSASTMFDRLADRCSDELWGYFPEPSEEYVRLRRLTYLNSRL